jgi:hypothetical protein
MSSKIRLADVVKGGGAEFIFLGAGAPLIISGGQRLSLDMRIDNKLASIFIVDANGEVEICSGGIAEVSETYQSLISELKEKQSCSFIRKHSRFLLGTAIGIAVASVIAIALISSPVGFSKNPSDEISNDDLMQLMQALQPNDVARRSLPNLPVNAQPTQPTMPPILDRPDFLKKPDIIAPAPETPKSVSNGVEQSAAVDNDNTSDDVIEPAFGLPAFDPDAFKEESAKAISEADKSDTKTDETSATSEPVTEPKTEATLKAEETKPVVEAPKSAEPEVEAQKADDRPTPSASKVDDNPQSPTSDKSPNTTSQAEIKPITPVEARQQANAVVDRLIQGGMTNGQAGDVLKALESLASVDYSEITPEMISKLPHEVAYLLRENGIIGDVMEPTYTDGVPHRIIRLPDSVVDKYRGPDGVPTIPDANSWAATGNVVRIPPPGGGDLKSPEDFASFGIQTP